MTWNVRGSALPDLDDLAAVIRTYEPDVLALQEIRHGQALRLAHRLGYHVRWARKHFPYSFLLWWRAEGLAVMSPHPLEDRHVYLLSPGIHSSTYRRRIALRVRVRIEGVWLRVFDAHLASQADHGARVDQAIILAGAIAGERQRAEKTGEVFEAVLAGDLNAFEETDVLAPLQGAGFVDAWEVARSHVGTGATSTSAVPSRRIDYVLIEQGAECTSAETPVADERWPSRSDHLPVIVDVQIRSK